MPQDNHDSEEVQFVSQVEEIHSLHITNIIGPFTSPLLNQGAQVY